jgi:hypothetical protein
VLVVLVLAALVVVLPALARQTSTVNGVQPASAQGILPSTENVGGSNFSCAKAGVGYASPSTPTGMRQFQISKPTPGTYQDPATGVRFKVDPPTSGDPKASFNFSVVGGAAVVYHVGVNGGTKTAWYDYVNNDPDTPAIAGDGVYSDENVHSTPDSKYTTDLPTFFVASITTFCYRPLTVTPSCTKPFGPLPGLGGTGDAVQYSAQLELSGSACKSQNVVMFSYSPDTDELYAQLSPVGTGATYEVVERIQWSGITIDTQNPITLWYDDIPPYGDDKRDLVPCNSDPRDPAKPYELPGNAPHTGLMPPDDADGPHTSCMLSSTDSAGSGPDGRKYEAWIFSTVDGTRGH